MTCAVVGQATNTGALFCSKRLFDHTQASPDGASKVIGARRVTGRLPLQGNLLSSKLILPLAFLGHLTKLHNSLFNIRYSLPSFYIPCSIFDIHFFALASTLLRPSLLFDYYQTRPLFDSASTFLLQQSKPLRPGFDKKGSKVEANQKQVRIK